MSKESKAKKQKSKKSKKKQKKQKKQKMKKIFLRRLRIHLLETRSKDKANSRKRASRRNI